VLEAVARNARALEYAPEELRSDKDFVLQAVTLDGRALQYAPQDLRTDTEVVQAAARKRLGGKGERVSDVADEVHGLST
jgi:hypothetical protein